MHISLHHVAMQIMWGLRRLARKGAPMTTKFKSFRTTSDMFRIASAGIYINVLRIKVPFRLAWGLPPYHVERMSTSLDSCHLWWKFSYAPLSCFTLDDLCSCSSTATLCIISSSATTLLIISATVSYAPKLPDEQEPRSGPTTTTTVLFQFLNGQAWKQGKG